MFRLKFYPEELASYCEDVRRTLEQKKQDIAHPFHLLSDSSCGDMAREKAGQIKKRFERVYIFGMGGSILPLRALFSEDPGPLEFIESYSGSLFRRVVENVNENSHYIFISKSGKTLETCVECALITEKLKEKVLNPADHVTLITANPQSPLVEIAPRGCEILPLPDDISGRFSIFTNAVFLPAGILGDDMLQDVITAGRALVEAFEEGEVQGEILEFLSRMLKWYSEGHELMVVWIYQEHLRPLGRWFQQIWCESLGKPGADFQPDVTVARGPEDQHSLFQQFMEGVDRRFYMFLFQDSFSQEDNLVVKDDGLKPLSFSGKISLYEIERAQREGIKEALVEKGRKVVEVHLTRPGTVARAYFMGFTMLSVATSGFSQNIDPYNQPGVERGKILTKEKLRALVKQVSSKPYS